MLVKLVLVFPLSTAVCERGFSTLRRVKSDWYCSLLTPAIDDLMRVSIEGPSKLKYFDIVSAMNRWWLSVKKSKRPNTQSYGPQGEATLTKEDE